jgi:hypothetical protein
MPSYAKYLQLPFPDKLLPSGGSHATSPFNLALAGLGTMSPRIGTRFTPGGPPQAGASAMLSTPVVSSAGADCPTCNLRPIAFDPNLPHLGTFDVE